MADSLEQTLVQLTMRYPSATRLLRQAGLNYWSRGHRTVAEACDEVGVDPVLLRAVARGEGGRDPGPQWATRSVPALIEHLETVEHPRIRRKLRHLIEQACELDGLPGCPSRPAELVSALRELEQILLIHTEKEEELLFPLFLNRTAGRSSESIHSMEVEHDDQLDLFERIVDAATDPSRGRITSLAWARLGRDLRAFEVCLTEHIHLENNILFPRGFYESRC